MGLISRNPATVFWDTAAFVALFNKRDRYHAQAKRIQAELLAKEVPVFTTDAVLTEVADGLAAPAFRSLFVPVVETIRRDADRGLAILIHVDEPLWGQGWELYRNRPDKAWGLTDCISFVVMATVGIQRAFTSDRHFEQAGFIRLLTEED